MILPVQTQKLIPHSDSSSGSYSSDDMMGTIDKSQIVIDVGDMIELDMEDVQEETELVEHTLQYPNGSAHLTPNHLAKDASAIDPDSDIFDDFFARCDSPITGSNYGSNYGSNPGSSNNSDIDDKEKREIPRVVEKTISLSDITKLENGMMSIRENVENRGLVKRQKRVSRYKQLAYQDIERAMDKYYDTEDLENKFSSEIDILTTYMKGQKNVYIQSKHFSQMRLHMLMIPSLIITSLITVISPIIGCDEMNKWMISLLNGITALFLSLLNYLKLESSTEMYLQMASYYDKMETTLEMANSRLIIMDSKEEKRELVLSKIREIEEKMFETKETNTVLIPEQIKKLFPIVSHINIFSFIKKMENYKKTLLYKLKDVKNELRFILYKWKMEDNSREPTTPITRRDELEHIREQKRLQLLYTVKDQLKAEILEYRSAYGHIDEIITREINFAEKKLNSWGIWYICCWRRSNTHTNFKGLNPIIDKYFHFIFLDE